MQKLIISEDRGRNASGHQTRSLAVLMRGSKLLFILAALLLVYALVRSYATHRYLKGFADAIVPLNGSPQEKTEALLAWFRHTPSRSDTTSEGTGELRDPVNIVQNESLLRICGSASNAFLNLADVSGLSTRRLLLLDHSGDAMHVVTEVEWEKRWVVVDPQHGRVFVDHTGRPLTKEELRDPEVFEDAISRMPGYSPTYTFERTAHLRLQRIPLFGRLLQTGLDRLFPAWQEAIDWGYFPENPSLWPILFSIPLFLVAFLIRFAATRYLRPREEVEAPVLHQVASA